MRFAHSDEGARHDELPDGAEQRVFKRDPGDVAGLEAAEHGVDPGRVLVVLEEVERFSEGEIAHDIEGCEVVKLYQIECLGGSGDGFFGLGYQHVGVPADQGLLFDQSFVREGVGEYFPDSAMLSIVRLGDHRVCPVYWLCIPFVVFVVARSSTCAMPVDVLPGASVDEA